MIDCAHPAAPSLCLLGLDAVGSSYEFESYLSGRVRGYDHTLLFQHTHAHADMSLDAKQQLFAGRPAGQPAARASIIYSKDKFGKDETSSVSS